MSKHEIENAIEQLPVRQLHELADWLTEFRNQQWNKQIEEDAKAGRLDDLIQETKEEIRKGMTRPL